jgi:hypothetical protein
MILSAISARAGRHYFADGYLEELNRSPRSTCCGARDFFQLYPW